MPARWNRAPKLDEALANIPSGSSGSGFLGLPLTVVEATDGVRTVFTITGGAVNFVIPFLDRAFVVQGTDYTLITSNTQIQFTTAPQTGSVIGGLRF